MHRPTNTWWERNMVCLSADQFAENLLESNGADVKRLKFEGRSGVLMWNWTLEYLDHRWLHVQMKVCRQRRHSGRFPQFFRLHLRQMNTRLKSEDKECTRKHSGSEPSGQKSAEHLDAWYVRLLVRGSHTLLNASRMKMPRNVELLQIRTHDRWTRVRAQPIPTRRGQNQPLLQTTRTWRTEWMCKEYISNYRKLATKTVYSQHEQQHER